MDQQQYSNATRTSINQRSQDLQQPQTNTSQHNTLLSEKISSEKNQLQNEVQSFSVHRRQSQQYSSHNILHEQKQLSVSQPSLFHPNIIQKQLVPNQQSQLEANQNQLLIQRLQMHRKKQLDNNQEESIFFQDYKQEVSGIENLNLNNVQNYNQNNQVYQEEKKVVIHSTVQNDLLDFGPSIQEQIQCQRLQEILQNKEQQFIQDKYQQNVLISMEIQAGLTRDIPMEIQTKARKNLPMDVQSESIGSLTEKESHKNEKIYYQRQKEWKNNQQHSCTSQKSDIEQVHFYEEKMPQNSSNLFRFGFTITSVKKDSNKMKDTSQQQQRLQLNQTEKNIQKEKYIQQFDRSQAQNRFSQKNGNKQSNAENNNEEAIQKTSQQQSQNMSKDSNMKLKQQQIKVQSSNNSQKNSIYQKQVRQENLLQIQEVKDQLPSQIPPDQLCELSDSHKCQAALQIEFQSISAISMNEKKNQIKNFKFESIQENSNNFQNDEINQSEKIIEQLQKIHKNKDRQRDLQNFLFLQNLIKNHINLITLRPLDQIGHKILENGQYAIMFIDLFVMSSPILHDRKIFHKYLVFSLSHNVHENKQTYQKYKQQYWPRKSEKFTIIDCFNIKNSPQNNQQQGEIDQKYSVEVHDTSVHYVPRSIMKSNRLSHIKEPRTQLPIHRKPANIRISYYSHQKVRATKNFISSLKKEKKIKQTKKRVIVEKQDTPQKSEKLGYAQTFITVEDKNGNQVLKMRKVSLRLLEKSNKSKSQSKYIKKSVSKAKKRNNQKQQINSQIEANRKNSVKASVKKKRNSIRRSVAKTQRQQQNLTADYVKSHFQELNIDTYQLKMLTGTPLTEADKQIAKMLEQYQKIVKQQERLALDLQASNHMVPVQQPQHKYEDEQDTRNLVSFQRIREIEQQLQKNKLKKYKIMQQLTQKHIVIETIIDPDINQHGIYALVKVSKMTSIFCGAQYFIIPMSRLQLCSRDKIDEDIRKIKSLVQMKEKDNIGILKPSSKLQEAIQLQKIKRAKLQENK